VRVISSKKEALQTLSIPKNLAWNPLTFRGKEIDKSVDCGGIIRTFERELGNELNAPSHSKRVTLPLVPSNEPGTLDLKDFNFDNLLA
jgi:hypothetical protein